MVARKGAVAGVSPRPEGDFWGYCQQDAIDENKRVPGAEKFALSEENVAPIMRMGYCV